MAIAGERGVFIRQPLLLPDGGEAGSSPIITEIRERQPLQGKIGLVTGTARGIGAEIAVALGKAGSGVIGTHVDPGKEGKQTETGKRVRQFGVPFESVTADVTDEQDRLAMLYRAVGNPRYPRKIDYLVLNAAGGLEKGKPENWAEMINVDAQRALVDMFLPYMNEGGAIIFMTSLWAHKYGELNQLPAYGPVASTKNRAERELRERQDELAERGIKLGFVVGHVITGTAAHSLFTRGAKEEMARLEQLAAGGKFPEAADMGNAVQALLARDFAPGETVYIGGTNAEPLNFPTGELQRPDIAKIFNMYDDSKLLVNTFERTGNGTGSARYTVRESDTEGHFTGPYADLSLFRGVDQIEAMAQAGGLTLLSMEGNSGALGVFQGIRGGIRFERPLKPGLEAEIYTRIIRRSREGVIIDTEMQVNGVPVSNANGVDIAILPNERTARMVLAQKFAELNTPAA